MTANETLVDDEILVGQAKSDPGEFRLLYEKYFHDIFLFVYRRVNDQDTSNDITQQVFLKALLHLKNYTHRGFPFSSYLYRIAVNECNQFFRDTTNVRHVTIDAVDPVHLPLELESGESFTEIRLPALSEALKKLSDKELLLIELRFFEKMSFKEIGFILQITENLSKVRTYRLLNKIKKIIQNEEYS